MSLEADLERLRSLEGVKWTKHGPDVLAAWVADMDLEPAPVVLDAIRSVVDRGDFGYHSLAREQLAPTFAARQRERHGWDIDAGDVQLFNDVLHGIETIIWMATGPGDGIVVLPPIYPPFRKAILNSGRTIVDCPLDVEGWRLNAETLRSVVDDNTKVLLLCSPHNPTGRVFDDDELEAVAEVCEEHDLLVVSDEVWGDLTHPGAVHRPFALFAPDRTVTMSSASKSFSLAGLRCAVAHVGDARVKTTIDGLPPHLLGAVNTIGATATMAGWTEGDAWLDATKAHIVAQRDHLAARIEAEVPAVKWQRPEATYLAWLDVGAYDLGPDPAGLLLDEGRVALSPGLDYGPGGERFVRMNLATTRSVLDAVIDRTFAVLAARGGTGRVAAADPVSS